MTDQLNFSEEDKPTLGTGLNVLTILTFVGCGILLISSIYSFLSAEKSYDAIVKAQDNMANAPAWVKGMMGPEMVEMAKKTMENKIPILLLNLVGVALCTYGAMEMRKLKKQGFVIWLAGEVVPIIASFLFVGVGVFKGFSSIILLFPIIFIILYSVQRKNLVY